MGRLAHKGNTLRFNTVTKGFGTNKITILRRGRTMSYEMYIVNRSRRLMKMNPVQVAEN